MYLTIHLCVFIFVLLWLTFIVENKTLLLSSYSPCDAMTSNFIWI